MQRRFPVLFSVRICVAQLPDQPLIPRVQEWTYHEMSNDKSILELTPGTDGSLDLVLIPPSRLEHVHDQHKSDYSEDEPESRIVEITRSRHRSDL